MKPYLIQGNLELPKQEERLISEDISENDLLFHNTSIDNNIIETETHFEKLDRYPGRPSVDKIPCRSKPLLSIDISQKDGMSHEDNIVQNTRNARVCDYLMKSTHLTIKILILGKLAVGKSSLILNYLNAKREA